MWLRIAEHSQLGHLPEVLVKFRSHPAQGSMNFELQISDEQALFRDLFERLGPARFFPELEQVHDPHQRMARGRSLLADELRSRRRWYRFALEQYRIADQIHPSWSTNWKMVQAQAAILTLGDECQSLTFGKRARIYLGQGEREQARRLSMALFLRHPLRLDMLLIWLASWVPPRWMQALKQVKRRLKP
jgi:hypothetical protein